MRVRNLLPILAFASQVQLPQNYNDFVEVCSGDGNLSRALRSSGYQGVEFDIKLSKNHDLMRTVGFTTILLAVANIRPGGLLMFAPPCSTWIFLSTSVTKRCWERPGGDESRACVRYANMFIRRMIYILYFAAKRGVKILLEQPASSVLWHWAPMRRLLSWLGARRVAFPMGSYGASSLKMTVLYGTINAIHTLRRPLDMKKLQRSLRLARSTSKDLVTKVVRSGKVRVTGRKRNLERSGSYPYRFGLAVASLIAPYGLPLRNLDLQAGQDDPDYDDAGALDDFLHGRSKATWRG